ncbi:MAG: hypothetical protein HYS33_03350 [Acidobacteria bacterium]|nr:hypothetical protein [Acidobacteriota bacterium]
MIRLDISRRGGLFSMLGSLLWIVTWVIVGFVGGGSPSERLWRTVLLNPAMLLLMAGLAAFQKRQAERSGQLGKGGFAVCLLGIGTMLLGNVVEFWVSEYFYGTQRPGWVMMGIGLTMLPVGFVLLGFGTLRAKVFTGWRRVVPSGVGLMLLAIRPIYLSDGILPMPAPSGAAGVALGWLALGYALWSEKTNSSDAQIAARV